MKKIIALILPMLFVSTLVFAALQINPVTGKLDKTGVPEVTLVDFDSTDYGDATWGSGTAFDWTFNAGATDPIFSFSSGAVDLDNAIFTIHGTNSQIKFANNMLINGDTSRKLKITSTGGSFNEDLLLDNDTNTNTFGISSTTGVTNLDFGTIGLRNTATNNAVGNISVGTSGTPGSALAVASNVSIGTAYAVAHAAPTNGLAVQGNVGIGTWIAQGGALIVNGNVGVGTGFPGVALDVNGTVRATAFVGALTGNASSATTATTATALTVNPAPCGAGNFVNDMDANGTLTCGTPSAGVGTPVGNTGAVQYASSGVFAGDETKFSFNGTNVGIGTSNAINGLFDVRGGAAFSGNVGIGTGATTGRLAVVGGNVGIGTWSPTRELQIIGNIGIGTAAPSFTSNGNNTVIVGNNSTTIALQVVQGTSMTTGAALDVSSASSNVTQNTPLVNITASNASGNMNGLTVDVRSSGKVVRFNDQASDTTPFAIDSVGNVGVGTFNPAGQLDVRYQSPTPPLMVGSSATDATGAYFKVDAGGNVGVGSIAPGTLVDVAGNLRLAAGGFLVSQQATAPTVASNDCGTTSQGTVAAGSSDLLGTLTAGTLNVTSCAMTFNKTHNTAPLCLCEDNTNILGVKCTTTTTKLTVTSTTSMSGDTVTYFCPTNAP